MSKHLSDFQLSDTESDSNGISTLISTDNTSNLLPSSSDSSFTSCYSDEKPSHKRARSFSSDSLSGEESDSHEGRLAARRRGRRSMKPGSSWAFQKALRDDVKKSKNFPANSRLDNFRKKIYDEDPRVMLPTLNIIQDAHG
jgi:hypothetical protein